MLVGQQQVRDDAHERRQGHAVQFQFRSGDAQWKGRAAQAQLANAREQLSYTALIAEAPSSPEIAKNSGIRTGWNRSDRRWTTSWLRPFADMKMFV